MSCLVEYLKVLTDGEPCELPKPNSNVGQYLYQLAQNAMSGGGGVSSWNDLTDKPFDSEVIIDYEWSESYEPLESIAIGDGVYFNKISNTPWSVEDIVGCEVVVHENGEEISSTVIEEMLEINENYINAQVAISALADIDLNGLTLTKGVWVSHSELTYVVKIFKENVTKLDVKYLPEALYTEIDGKIESYIAEALGGEY